MEERLKIRGTRIDSNMSIKESKNALNQYTKKWSNNRPFILFPRRNYSAFFSSSALTSPLAFSSILALASCPA